MAMPTLQGFIDEYSDLSLNKIYGEKPVQAIWSTSYQFVYYVLPQQFREQNPDIVRSMTLWLFIVWVTDSVMDNYVDEITQDDFQRVSQMYCLDFLHTPPASFEEYLKNLRGNYSHGIPAHYATDGNYPSPDSPPVTVRKILRSHPSPGPEAGSDFDTMNDHDDGKTPRQVFVQQLMQAVFEAIERVYLHDFFEISMPFINRNKVAWQSLAYWTTLFLRATYEAWTNDQFHGEEQFRQYRLHTGGMMCIFSHVSLYYNINILDQTDDTLALWKDAAILVAYLNDIASLPRDIRTKTPNLVSILALEHNIDCYDALDMALQLTSALNHKIRASALYDTPARLIVEGCYDWERAEVRYETGLILAQHCHEKNVNAFQQLLQEFTSPRTTFAGEPTH